VLNKPVDDVSKEPSSAPVQELAIIKDNDAPETEQLDLVAISDHETTGNQSMVPRVMRNGRKRRHGDMAYEGDDDWEILLHQQGFLTKVSAADVDRSARIKEKPGSSDLLGYATRGRTAAVAAGLKVSAAGPIERIKFKEVLKRKGGLQEYLDCRSVTFSHKEKKNMSMKNVYCI